MARWSEARAEHEDRALELSEREQDVTARETDVIGREAAVAEREAEIECSEARLEAKAQANAKVLAEVKQTREEGKADRQAAQDEREALVASCRKVSPYVDELRGLIDNVLALEDGS